MVGKPVASVFYSVTRSETLSSAIEDTPELFQIRSSCDNETPGQTTLKLPSSLVGRERIGSRENGSEGVTREHS